MNEFELIARYFSRPPRDTGFVAQAGGDDCALLNLGDRQLAVTTDLLVEGRHFLPEVDPAALGHKALAVNLSDLAAAGATPRCFFLALALPRVELEWLDAFSAGLYALADAHDCVLAGGDTTRAAPVAQGEGPRTFCITAVGEVPVGQAHGRGGARPGDELWVSGSLGDAALVLLPGGLDGFPVDPAVLGEAGVFRGDDRPLQVRADLFHGHPLLFPAPGVAALQAFVRHAPGLGALERGAVRIGPGHERDAAQKGQLQGQPGQISLQNLCAGIGAELFLLRLRPQTVAGTWLQAPCPTGTLGS